MPIVGAVSSPLTAIATDSPGNVYTLETNEGKRLQKFTYKGLGPVAKKDQGVLWPKK